MRFAVLVALGLAGLGVAQDWEDVAEIFRERCVICHSGEFAPLDLRLDSHVDVLRGSETGPVVRPGAPAESPLMGRIAGVIEPRMPMDGPPFLDAEQIAAGAPDGAAAGATAPAEPARPEGEVRFGDVAPIFLQRCAKCHSDGSIMGTAPEGLHLTSYDAVLQGGERIVIVPGTPALSPVWRHVQGLEEPRMPFDGPPFLEPDEIALIATWIADGARDVAGDPAPMPVGRELRVEGILTAERELDGGAFVVTGGTRVEDGFRIGGRYELRAVIGPLGEVIAERFRAR